MVDRSTPGSLFGSLFDGMKRRFEAATRDWAGGDTSGGLELATGDRRPEADLADRGGEYVLAINVPGYGPDDLEVELTGDVVRVRGDRETPTDAVGGEDGLRERRHNSFDRRITLPEPVDPGAATARLENETLTVELPTLEASAGSRSIEGE